MNKIGFSACMIFAALGIAGAAVAQSRPSTTSMTCAQAQAAVQGAGVIVLGTGGQSYDRFVSNESFCTSQEIGKPVWGPTRDNPQCFIGLVCEPRSGRDATPP
ncbi:MAG: hypothetical protein ACK4MV_08930 [Beijerinckiaceae bacterium]